MRLFTGITSKFKPILNNEKSLTVQTLYRCSSVESRSQVTEEETIHCGHGNDLKIPPPELELEYLCNTDNRNEIKYNIENRKGTGNIDKLLELYNKIKSLNTSCPEYEAVHKEILTEAVKIPNKSHPDIIVYGEKPKVVKVLGECPKYDYKPRLFDFLTKRFHLVRNDNITNFTGHRSYFFMGQLADLESALIKWSLKKLITRGFKIISVPNILNRNIIEACGMATRGERSQVYNLSEEHYGKDLCLSGTAEMSIGGYFMNKNIQENELPMRIAAVSRCFRAETSRVSDERGIFRVHQFTKVEMFGLSHPEKSDELLEEFCSFEEEHFSSLGLHLQVLDMPLHELGAQAYRKYDIEAWLPGKDKWGEISSCSNCTDYQSRRLNIKCNGKHVHTVNGTACAVPRMVIAILETHQRKDGTISIPAPLQPFMKGQTLIDTRSNVPDMKLLRLQPWKARK